MLNRLIKSFLYADEGIVSTINKERNMRIHVVTSLFVIILSLILNISSKDTLFILLAIGLVISAELFNTAIENTIDVAVQGRHLLAKRAKDAAAGGVLFITFVAILIGITVFYPQIEEISTKGWVDETRDPLSFFVLVGLFNIIMTYMMKAFWYSRNKRCQPYLMIGIVFYFLSILSISLHFYYSIIILFVILGLVLMQRKKCVLFRVSQNVLISIGLFYLSFWLLF